MRCTAEERRGSGTEGGAPVTGQDDACTPGPGFRRRYDGIHERVLPAFRGRTIR
ncbi:MAG: hypothetical protein JSV33_15430 [bacterium]|nr:MAG: hypothetical protein JSV33_15430 [bacterium]